MIRGKLLRCFVGCFTSLQNFIEAIAFILQKAIASERGVNWNNLIPFIGNGRLLHKRIFMTFMVPHTILFKCFVPFLVVDLELLTDYPFCCAQLLDQIMNVHAAFECLVAFT